jgi:hypothetical protein
LQLYRIKDAVPYLSQNFAPELVTAQGATNDGYPGTLDERAEAFQSLRSKRLFLFCCFFSTLIDQAIHASHEEHPYSQIAIHYSSFTIHNSRNHA